ncbi:terminase TerL endonuclease subunit, partial [Pseudomonas aeruginosa]|uniref:terminase TerL endonuclease subunit n=1 Tax=Pseudomonas aeruginosa TaxID=287 RepID=UPI00345A2B76
QGLLKTTEGAELDFAVVREDVQALMPRFNVLEIVYDPWRATQLAHEFAKDGATVVEYRQIVQLMSPPMKELQAAIAAGRVHHDGNEIT